MADFEFVTVWRLPAPVQIVWDEIHAIEHWPSWWSSVRRVEWLEPGDPSGLGSVRRIVWRGRFPYEVSVVLRVTRIEAPNVIEGVASGDLTGWGCWQLTGEGRETVVRFDWRVDVRRPWMRMTARVLRPFFRWNHDQVMQAGQRGLLRRIQRELVH